MSSTASWWAVAGAALGASVPVALHLLRQFWQLDVSNYSRYESVLLILWPSSFLLLPFERVPWLGLVLSILINAAIYAAIAASLCMYLRSRSLPWLTLPSLYVLYCVAVAR